ncbi:MAG: lysylphosphatidylglycerol synthase transmembrane domain-containing protein [Anaerolineae bacterium]
MQPISKNPEADGASDGPSKSRGRYLQNVLKVVVSTGLLALVILQADLGAVWDQVARADPVGLALALLVVQAGVMLRAGRWMALMRGLGDTSPYKTLLYLYYVGAFFNTFLPTGFGGDAIRIYELSQGGSTASAISTVLAERALGLLVQFAAALAVLPFAWRLVPSEIALLLLAIVVVTFVATALFMNHSVMSWVMTNVPLAKAVLTHPKVQALYASFHRYPRRSLTRAVGVSLVFTATLVLSQLLLGRAIGIDLGIAHYAVFVPILSTLLLVPITIGGLGVREGGYVLLFGQAGVPHDQALALSLLTYAMALVSGIIGGVLYVTVGALRLRAGRDRTLGAR